MSEPWPSGSERRDMKIRTLFIRLDLYVNAPDELVGHLESYFAPGTLHRAGRGLKWQAINAEIRVE